MARIPFFPILSIFCIVLCSAPMFAQVHFSETFQKTIKKIAKDRVKAEVIDWVTQKDPISGIVARDLIAQVIDSKDEKVLLQSTSNVVLTMLFLGGVRNRVEAILDTTREIELQAKNVSWNREQLIGYTTLYFYFSERMKYGLPVAAEILKMTNEKNAIESFRTKTGRKWNVVVSQQLVRLRRMDKDISLDVRTLEFIEKSVFLMLFHKDTYKAEADSAFESLCRAYTREKDMLEMLRSIRDNTAIEEAVLKLFDNYVQQFQRSYKTDNVFLTSGYGFNYGTEYKSLAAEAVTTAEVEMEKAQDRISNVFASTFRSLIQSAKSEFVQHEQFSAIIMNVLRDLIDNWIVLAKQNGWRIDYVFSLSGTTFVDNMGNTVDFTILDQVRLTTYGETTRLFLFVGGFFDPLIKNTVYKDGAKVYLAGVGVGYKTVYVSFSAAIPYPQFDLKESRFAVTIGYEIPVEDIVE